MATEDQDSEIEYESAKTFAKNVSYLMQKTGWSQLYLASQLDVGQSIVGRYMRGAIPRADVLDKLCKVFGISLEELFKTDSPPTPRIERSSIADEIDGAVRSAVKEAFENVDLLKDQEIKKLKAELEALRQQVGAPSKSTTEEDELVLLCRQVPDRLRRLVCKVVRDFIDKQPQSSKRTNQG